MVALDMLLIYHRTVNLPSELDVIVQRTGFFKGGFQREDMYIHVAWRQN